MKHRPATIADANTLHELIMSHRQLLTIHPEGVGAEEFFQSVSTEAIAEQIASPRYHHVLAEDDAGEVIGYVAIRDESHLFHLFVAKNWQGMGLARKLWSEIRQQTEGSDGSRDFTVNSSLNAVPIYERFGFAPAGQVIQKHGVAFLPMKLSAKRDDA